MPAATLEYWRQDFEACFRSTCTELYNGHERLHEACRYALEGGGKRIRPLLCLASCYAMGQDYRQAMGAAKAVEWIHTYSLVHDDLPLMDDDDWRRGRLSTHRQFDEATALLVGDALLADAFYILSLEATHPTQSTKVLARAAGGLGMVRGQALDLYWTGRDHYSLEDLERVHQHKTGDLIAASCALGAIAAGAKPEQVEHLSRFGRRLGLAFQIVDDLLDISTQTGKSAGKDKSTGKLTYLRLMDESAARREASRLTELTLRELDDRGETMKPLSFLAQSLLQRTL